MRSEIRVSTQLATTVCPTPLATAPLELLSPLPLPPIKQDLDVFVPRELLQEILPKIRLVSRHNHYVAHIPSLSVTRIASRSQLF